MKNNRQNIKISIIDDEDDFLEEMAFFLSQKGFNVVSTIQDPLTYEGIFKQNLPHIVLLDFVMPTLNGEEVAHMIAHRYPDIAIVYVTAKPFRLELLPKNVRAAVQKGEFNQKIIPVIESLSAYVNFEKLSPFQKRVIKHKQENENAEQELWHSLTPREKDISLLLVKGLCPRQISEKLGLEYTTVKRYVSDVRAKFYSKNMYDLLHKLNKIKISLSQSSLVNSRLD